MKSFAIFVSGGLFGVGVTLSGMTNPMRVLNFLDFTGRFDPTLILVMGFGLLTTLVGYRLIFRLSRPLFSEAFHIPKANIIDTPLIAGAVLFGLGWGLAGFCPGPAVASLVFGRAESFIFVLAMAAGILVARFSGPIIGRTRRAETASDAD